MKKLQINKTLSIIAIVLLLILTTVMTNTNSVNAADVTTYSYLATAPNPAGVNQQVQVNGWVEPLQPTSADLFHDITITITKPDGTTETKGPYTSSQVGSVYFVYTPTTIGEYSFQLFFPGESFPNGDFYVGSESPITVLTVQEEPIQARPEVPLPTDYWTRPINAQNRGWSSISGNWLSGGGPLFPVSHQQTSQNNFEPLGGNNPYSEPVKAPHIMWTKELYAGGLVGGIQGDISYYPGLTYQPKVTPPVIMNGKLYYNTHYAGFLGGIAELPGFKCVDLRTGEELYENPDYSITFGQEWLYDSPNQKGVVGPYLWGTGTNAGPNTEGVAPNTWNMFDANTGTLIASFENGNSIGVFAGAHAYGTDGSMYAFVLNGFGPWLAMWNSTLLFERIGWITYQSPTAVGRGIGAWHPVYGTYDWLDGIQWNVSIPVIPPKPTNPGYNQFGEIISGIADDVLVAHFVDLFGSGFGEGYLEVGYSMTTGEQLWSHPLTVNIAGVYRWFGEGIFVDFDLATRTFTAFDAATGNQLWVSDPTDYPWGTYPGNAVIANGMVYFGAYDGNVHAFDVETGERVWKFSSGNSGLETPYGTWPIFGNMMVTPTVIYAANNEHSPTIPLYRDEKLYALDATTGESLWSITGYWNPNAIVDGYLVGYSAYDNRMYVFGKGPSATTVTAPKTEVMQGQKMVIEGTVTDQSTGAMDSPAISDEDMSAWMEYMYMQQPFPSDVTGVDVSIDVIDTNGNFRNIGTATSDISGVYSLVWEPDIPGKYTVIATFAGSDSYGSSFAQTNFYVEEAPAPTPPPESTPAPQTDTYVLGTGIAILAVVVIFGLLLLRKK
jgi:outer membrane protein assembly factor BamB